MGKFLSPLKAKNLYKTFNNIKITLLCGFVTILVLRGTIGMGGLRMPASTDTRQDFPFSFREANRVLSALSNRESEDADDDDDSTAELPTNEPYVLGPKVTDWDDQRKEWIAEHADISEYPHILLVTGSPPSPCTHHVGDHFLLKSVKNKIDYARIHGIEIFYNMAQLDAHMVGFWSKLPLLRKLMLTHPEMEWLWWMDSDAMFTDMTFEVPLEKYKDHNLVMHGWEEEVQEKKAWVGLNTGSFLLRNCEWSLDLLDVWAAMGAKGSKVQEELADKILSESVDQARPVQFNADDQSALIYLLIKEKDKWGNKVFFENNYYLHGYWVNIVESFEDLMMSSHPGYGDERWPFITHFVGCKPCGSHSDDSAERCLKHMERTFNFGDNQVLQKYGFAHLSLSTFKIKKTRNETSSQQPLVLNSPNELNY